MENIREEKRMELIDKFCNLFDDIEWIEYNELMEKEDKLYLICGKVKDIENLIMKTL